MTNKTHIISVSPDGILEYTRHPELTEFFNGDGKMERITDIRKKSKGNQYYIHWLKGPFAGKNHTYGMSKVYGLAEDLQPWLEDVLLTFYTYEQAVQHEIAMLNAMRLTGVSFYG